MLIGYPEHQLSGWQIQQMEEDERNHKWEDLNEPESDYVTEARTHMKAAMVALGNAGSSIDEAAEMLDGSVNAQILALCNDNILNTMLLLKKLTEWG